MLQERLQYREEQQSVFKADQACIPICLTKRSELTVAALELIRPLLMVKGTWSIFFIQSLMADSLQCAAVQTCQMFRLQT